MCGINGFLNYSGVHVSDAPHSIRRMNDELAHRGPDGMGVWADPNAGIFLGHRRLSIIDLSAAGGQPMVAPSGNVIVFNGEIYNYRELKQRLPGVQFRSSSDTEVLLQLYQQRGRDLLQDLNGMFGFAIWDASRQEIFLARDRIGIKPLYYTTIGGIFAFSSEIKALLTLPWVRPVLDSVALHHFLTYGKLFAPRTMFEGIYKLPPGHCMVVDRTGIQRIEQYWEVSYTNLEHAAEEDIERDLLSMLRTAVRRRLVSDVPVGAFLSGGVDSSAIVALMAEAGAAPLQTYSIGFEGQANYDESAHARKVAERYGTTHFEHTVTPAEIRDFLPRIVDTFDEPLADATAIPIFFISGLARKHGSIVVLTGDGSDELFCGYRNWLQYVRLNPAYERYSALPRAFKRGVLNSYSALGGSPARREILTRAAQGQELFWAGANAYKDSVKRDVIGTALAPFAGLSSWEEIQPIRRAFDAIPQNGRASSFVDWMCFQGIKSLVPNMYLHRADRLGMAHGVELRVPFLDHEMVNYGLSIPGRLKVRNGEPKYILKRALESILPKDVLYRRKQGFCVPLKEWAADVMLDHVDANAERFCRDHGIFNAEGVRNQVRLARVGGADNVSALWMTYFLMAWFDKWLP